MGFQDPVEFHQHSGKVGPVPSRFQVPGGLSGARNTSEHVLDAQGQKHLPMGLDFGKVDNHIRLHDLSGNLESPKHKVIRRPHLNGFPKLEKGSVHLFRHLGDSRFGSHPTSGFKGRTVSHIGHAPCLLDHLDDSSNNHGVGGNPFPRSGGNQEVWLQQHLLTRFDESPHSPQKIDRLPDRLQHAPILVILTPNNGDLSFHHDKG